MLFNLFKNKNDDEEPLEEEEILARISYIIKKDSSSPIVDVELNNYDDESIKSLASIIDILSRDKFITETVDIIKNAMTSDNKSDHMIKFFSYLDLKTKNKLLNTYKNVNSDEEPCIKPSDIFTK